MVLKYKELFLAWTALAIIYIIQVVVLAPSHETLEKYHLTAMQASLLGLALALPYVIIWFIALVGYVRFRSYVSTVRPAAKERPALRILSYGLFGLSLWLPFSAILSNAFSRLYHSHPDATAWLTRLENYLVLLLLFASFAALYHGAKKLSVLGKQLPYSLMQSLIFVIFVALVSLYAVFILHDPARQHPHGATTVASYYLPDWLIITTVLLPRIVMWTLGFLAIQYLYTYWRSVKGVIYRQAFHSLSLGLGFVIMSSIFIGYTDSLPTSLGNLSLLALLLLAYALLALLSIGYLLIASGAQRLKRIEEL